MLSASLIGDSRVVKEDFTVFMSLRFLNRVKSFRQRCALDYLTSVASLQFSMQPTSGNTQLISCRMSSERRTGQCTISWISQSYESGPLMLTAHHYSFRNRVALSSFSLTRYTLYHFFHAILSFRILT